MIGEFNVPPGSQFVMTCGSNATGAGSEDLNAGITAVRVDQITK